MSAIEIGLCFSPEMAGEMPVTAFDFLEANVQGFLVPEKNESEFAVILEIARAFARPVKTANCFLPGDLKCVGPQIDHARLLRYAETAFERAERMGIETIVFGSGGARSVPEGHPMEHAMTEFSGFLRLIGPIAARHGVTVVVEPLSKGDCNFINSLREGAEAVERCNHPNVRLLADVYHMRCENEPADAIARFGHLLKHVHVAELAGRYFPGKAREDFRPSFRALKQAGYSGRIALECFWDDVRADAPSSVQFVREQLADAGF